MATYNKEYYYSRQRRKNQKYALIERIIDFAKLPMTSGHIEKGQINTTAWALNDVLEAIHLRAGTTVLGVQVEVLTASADSGDRFQLGYGSIPSKWGVYSLYGQTSQDIDNTGFRDQGSFHQSDWVYFSSADTIDIKIRKAALQGKIRLIVHVLEDDR
jgi:hypothetical protein